ncbi:hypothetical protein ACWDY7_13035 [Streptomyces calvus]|uniref:Uncharacterized protein n=1 Tax=Streptomyces calvus TaxID=67282 RepID=A0AA40SEP7_9ACTN|nr:hypothetical protein [Streptomyces calvus]MBA8944770.1 hypothetical protein [Streptomyces calvus]
MIQENGASCILTIVNDHKIIRAWIPQVIDSFQQVAVSHSGSNMVERPNRQYFLTNIRAYRSHAIAKLIDMQVGDVHASS